MKLKQLPEDFIVEEINQFDLKQSGDYKLFIVEKIGVESFYFFRYMSGKNKIPLKSFGFAGLKDKHAITKQYFTLPKKYDIMNLIENNFKISFVGFVDKQLSPGHLIGNKFELIVRDVKKGENEGILLKAERVMNFGVPNYFDSQRFGSVIHGDFIAKFVIKHDFESAVKLYLTEYSKSENRDVKDDKRAILENWDNLSKLKIKSNLFKSVVDEYLEKKDWLSAYNVIPGNLRNMFVNAYQSYLWNECIKEILRRFIDKKNLYTVDYNIGNIVFFKSISESELNNLPKSFKTISPNVVLSDFEKDIIIRVLSRENISLSDFNIKEITGDFFGNYDRPIIIKPTDFSISAPLSDEVNGSNTSIRYKFILKFNLFKGNYATIISKAIFNQ